MQFFKIFVLAVFQGVAEFLPISSSGHLVIGKQLLGCGEIGLRLDIMLHFGTLLAVGWFYRKTVVGLWRGICAAGEHRRAAWRYLMCLVVSSIPVGIVGVFFLDEIGQAFSSIGSVGVALVFTGLVLTATRLVRGGAGEVGIGSAIVMGLAQALAVLPGVSRSGMTLASSRVMRLSADRAAEFSFLMSAPPIVGALALAMMRPLPAASSGSAEEVSWGLSIFGGIVAAVVGYYSLKLLLSSLRSDRFWLFGPYCIVAGVVCLMG